MVRCSFSFIPFLWRHKFCSQVKRGGEYGPGNGATCQHMSVSHKHWWCKMAWFPQVASATGSQALVLWPERLSKQEPFASTQALRVEMVKFQQKKQKHVKLALVQWLRRPTTELGKKEYHTSAEGANSEAQQILLTQRAKQACAVAEKANHRAWQKGNVCITQIWRVEMLKLLCNCSKGRPKRKHSFIHCGCNCLASS